MSTHAILGASSAHRWMQCPGTIKLTKDLPRQTSKYAHEGTAAHALAERVLNGELLIPQELKGTEIDGVLVTEEMCNAVSTYICFVDNLMTHEHSQLKLEQRVVLHKLGFNKLGEMFGTADAVVTYPDPTDPTKLVAHVIDYKHGRNVHVDVRNNTQLLYYGLGVIYDLMQRRRDLKKFMDEMQLQLRLTIVQPRTQQSDSQDTWDVSTEELLQFETDLLAAAKRVHSEPDVVVKGDHCRWCAAKDHCPAHTETVMTVWSKGMDNLSHDPLSMPTYVLSEALQQCLELEKAITAFRRVAQVRLQEGETIPAWRLEPTRPTRVWLDEQAVISRWLELYGNTHDLYDQRLPTVAQLQKQLGDEEFQHFVDLVVSRSSGIKLAQAQDGLDLLPNLS